MVKPVKQGRNERLILLELIGPAGAGKSSLLKALVLSDGRLRSGIGLRSLEHITAVALNTILLLPILLSFYSNSDKRRWRDIKKLVRLQTYYYLSKRMASDCHRAVLFDEGPVFLLAWLYIFCKDCFEDLRFKRWFERALAQWSESLDTIIWLDAPDSILAQRIRSREKPHRIKSGDDKEIAEFLARYRAAYELIVSRLTDHRGPKVIRLDTCHRSFSEAADEIQQRVAAALELISIPTDVRGADLTGDGAGLSTACAASPE